MTTTELTAAILAARERLDAAEAALQSAGRAQRLETATLLLAALSGSNDDDVPGEDTSAWGALREDVVAASVAWGSVVDRTLGYLEGLMGGPPAVPDAMGLRPQMRVDEVRVLHDATRAYVRGRGVESLLPEGYAQLLTNNHALLRGVADFLDLPGRNREVLPPYTVLLCTQWLLEIYGPA